MGKKDEGIGYDYFLGRTLARRRKRLGLNQPIAAEKMAIDRWSLSRFENGHKPLTEEVFFMICRVLETPAVEIANEAFEKYQAYLAEKEPTKRVLPSRPSVAQVLESYKLYAQSRHEEHEKEGEFLQKLLNYFERLKSTP